MNFSTSFLHALITWNLITFLLMGIDKHQAINKKWRISEKTLFVFTFLLGGVGVLLGMFLFRHKTKHWSFKILVPISILINLIVVIFIS